MTIKKAPSHLRAPTRAWWRSVIADYELEEHHRRILTLAGESWDRCEEARETITADGLFYTDRFGQPRSHPAVALERDSRIAFARLVRELDLDVEPPASSRAPGLGRTR